MTLKKISPFGHFAAGVIVMMSFAGMAQAGPPLICHTFQIGQAKSLPWVSHSWNLSGSENYDTKNLVKASRPRDCG